MKDFIMRVAFLVILLLITPLILSRFFSVERDEIKDEKIIEIYDKKTDTTFKMDLEQYIINVVSAEMPAGFHTEALKAQAVCARTYALRKVNKNLPEHKGADVCTDFSHCQAYSSDETLKKNWGENYKKNRKKLQKCVLETKGEVLTYNGDYAISVFHSCSNGKTENASDVWGGAYPYLTSVESKGDFEKSDYQTKVKVSKDDFTSKINSLVENTLSLTGEIKISGYEMTKGDNVKNVIINNTQIKGTDLRKLFSLKSTAFSISVQNDGVEFDVYGNGHGVGMSQYGANAMAKTNSKYDEILSHYYPGTKLDQMNN